MERPRFRFLSCPITSFVIVIVLPCHNEPLKRRPAYQAFLRRRDKVAKRMLDALLLFFDAIGPALSFFCLKKVDPDLKDEETSFGEIKYSLYRVEITKRKTFHGYPL